MARLIAVLVGLIALAALCVVLLTPTRDVENVTDGSRDSGSPPALRGLDEEPVARRERRERVRVADVGEPTPSTPSPPEPAPILNLRANADIAEDADLVPLQATIRPTDRSADAAPLSVSASIVPATTRFAVVLGAVPDAGTVRVSGESQIITHGPDGETFVGPVARTAHEFVTIDEHTGVIAGIANSLSGARQAAGGTTNPQGEVVGHATTWARLVITFEVGGTPYSTYLTVPKFDAGRPRCVQIFDGPSPHPSGR